MKQDVLSKKILLDFAITNVLSIDYTEFGVGIKNNLKNKQLKEKIQTGFLGKHPDAPSNMDLSESDIQTLNTYF